MSNIFVLFVSLYVVVKIGFKWFFGYWRNGSDRVRVVRRRKEIF